MVEKGVTFVLVLAGAFLVLIAAYSGMTGLASLDNVYIRNGSGVVSGNITQGDNFTLGATVNNTDSGRRGNLVATIWDNTGGIIWTGILNLISGANSSEEVFEVELSSMTPPFPNVSDIETFNYTVNITYENTTRDSLSGNLTIISESIVPLREGWNMVAFTMNGTDNSTTDRNVTLKSGWNLIGYSSKVRNATIDTSVTFNGTTSFNDAVNTEVIQGQFAYYDAENKKYQVAPLQTPELTTHQGYWVYLNASEDVNMTLEGVGGTYERETFSVSDLIFRNETSGEEITWATASHPFNGWIYSNIQYFDSVNQEWLDVTINNGGFLESWKGYFFRTKYPNITVIRRSYA
jgi:hypothetical protein